MAICKYKVMENKVVGTHSFYAAPVATGTLTFDDICEEASDGKSVTSATMKMCVEEYMKAARRELLRGFRVPLGENFLYLYPNIQLSVKDVKDQHDKVIVATAKMLDIRKAVSRVGCSVSSIFSDYFRENVSWQRVDPTTGVPITDEDVTDKDGTKTEGGGSTPGGTSSGGTTQGGTSSGGSGTEKEG